jgi:hypothetical protein
MQAEFHREGATIEEAAEKAEKAVEKIATHLVFGRVPAAAKARQRRTKQEVKVLYFRSLFGAEEDEGKVGLPVDEPVQFAMFAL